MERRHPGTRATRTRRMRLHRLILAFVAVLAATTAANASADTFRVRVVLDSRQVQIYRDGRILRDFTAAVGAPSTPTVTGRFKIIAHYRFYRSDGEPYAEFGGFVLAINAWRGAGQFWFHHGYGGDYGQAVSHGCIRLPDADVRWMFYELPNGTPVRIVS
jgi:lipoprotein-anchoring transpeptidase ErfK/SrfK